ncbi:hypothetical protein Lupro_02680 [Lutibacter profundi]|uniref:Uncharacterized protein n=1 Tax=Lutibacter profundi TaxID=1622118 RepID=A0A109RND4_9FLAO|nr:hypothetical protein [Lutibacter profundi]AMC10222.1 hypothetical protein Lupro_02680 [Lutibacter profundi]
MADQETNKKTIDDYKKDYEYFTGKASEINRSLALGGIAIIWIFKTTSNNVTSIPDILILPLIWLVVALGLDLLQYIVGGIIWWIYYKFKESEVKKGKILADADIKAPSILPGIIHLIYWSKLTSTIIAYYFLFAFLYSKFIEPVSS